jgi:hypothetical protein
MATSTPRDALIDAIALAIEADATLGGLRIVRGFPNDQTFELPAISITASGLDTEKRKRHTYRETVLGSGKIETIYETSRRNFAGMIELWCPNKTDREPLEIALDDLLEVGIPADYGYLEPSPPGLVLTLTRLYDAKIRVLIADKNEQDASGGRDGYFRVMYSFSASVPRLVRMEYNQATFTNTNSVSATEVVD